MSERNTQAAIAQLAARRSHNLKVVSSILTGRTLCSFRMRLSLRRNRNAFPPAYIAQRANPDFFQGPADLQSAALATELLTHLRIY